MQELIEAIRHLIVGLRHVADTIKLSGDSDCKLHQIADKAEAAVEAAQQRTTSISYWKENTPW